MNKKEVVTAFENGGNIMLVSDIKLGGKLEVKEGANVNLDMNGKTITLDCLLYTSPSPRD